MQLYKGLIDFLTDPENEKLLADNDFDTLYRKAIHSSAIASAAHLTELFTEAGVDPLPYLTGIPEYYSTYLPITSLHIPDNVTDIGMCAFMGCGNLQRTVLGSEVRGIGSNVFQGCKQLKEITWNSELTNIGSHAFEDCNFTNLSIPDSVRYIGIGCFEGCPSLGEVKLPNGLTNIAAYMFTKCKQLRTVTIGAKCQVIHTSAFESCDSLNTVHFGGSIQQWKQVDIRDWNAPIYLCVIKCRDGDSEYDVRAKKWIKI